jgi:EAL domain-containing protein (putative c-di-GMP-specific phosphodiesterase class I)
VVIDDFGTGYFSLSHLRQFPVDILKIASEFVQVAESDSKTAALAGAIVAMGSSMGIGIVAEGIETAQQAERMRVLGCAYGQGFYFAQPSPGEQVAVGVFDRLRRRTGGAGASSRPASAPEPGSAPYRPIRALTPSRPAGSRLDVIPA